jgi:hypothetical protein
MMRHGSSQYCANHARRAQYYGHPQGKPIAKKELQWSLKTARKFLTLRRDKASVKAAIAWLDDFLSRGAIMADSEPEDRAIAELRRLYDSGLRGQEALEILCAVFFLSEQAPHCLPDDQRLTFAYSRALSQSRKQEARIEYRRGRQRRLYNKAGASVHGEIGETLRHSLAPFFANLKMALTRQKEREEAMREPLD